MFMSESCDGCRCQDANQWHKYCPFWAQYCDSPGSAFVCLASFLCLVCMILLFLYFLSSGGLKYFSQSSGYLDDYELQEDLWKVQV